MQGWTLPAHLLEHDLHGPHANNIQGHGRFQIMFLVLAFNSFKKCFFVCLFTLSGMSASAGSEV